MRRDFRYLAAMVLGAGVPLGGTPLAAQTFDGVSRVAALGVTHRVYPGAVVIVGRLDSVLLSRGFGRLTWSPRSRKPVPDSTLWDVASLTKVVATTGVAARFVDRGLLDLDAPVSRYLPAFAGGDRPLVTVQMLLNHTSGLPAFISLWQVTAVPGDAIARICIEPLRRPPGSAAEYSDLNAILLGAVLEVVGGAPLDVLVEREVVTPLGLGHTRFRLDASERGTASPTTSQGTIRTGTVNDPNAAYLGGVAGHAGLFSTGPDLARVARAWLGMGTLDGMTWLSAATVRRFLQRSPSAGTRLLGWDTPDTTGPEPSSFGRHPDPGTYGHTGWTGTQMWMDPERDVYVIFLTNRAYEPRVTETFQALRRVRAQLADAVVAAVPCPAVAGSEC
jgi:CubicO group peptidase (beta-lactamase class C family)